MVSTADVRDIGEVVDDLRKLVVRKLPGTNKMTNAVWACLNEAAEMISFSKGVLTEDNLSDYRRWMAHGEIQACSRIIRDMAEQLGVTLFKEGTVFGEPDGNADPARSD